MRHTVFWEKTGRAGIQIHIVKRFVSKVISLQVIKINGKKIFKINKEPNCNNNNKKSLKSFMVRSAPHD